MRKRAREQQPPIRSRLRRRTREQKLDIGRVKRVRLMRTRRRAKQAIETTGLLLGRANRTLSRIRPPQPDTGAEATPTKSVRASVLSATLCLGLAALLVSGKIVQIADRLPLGPDRDRWLEAATETDRLADGLSLNRPYDLLRDLRGADDGISQQIDVIGDVEELLQLAATAATEQPVATTTTVPPIEQGASTETTTSTSTTTPTTTTTTTTTTVPPEVPSYVRPEPVSAESPLLILVAGDSQAFYLGHGLRAGELSDALEVVLVQRHSTGLARPGYFNWPVHFFDIASDYDPEVVVATLGSNDWQGMRSPEGGILRRGRDGWRAEWSRRLGVTFDVLKASHRRVIWVGLPPTRSDIKREGYAVMNELAAEVSAERDFVTMIDIWDMFGGDEPYRDAVPPPDDPDGRPVDVRQQDGVHLNQAGAGWVVDLIAEEIEQIIAEISPEPASDPQPAFAAR